MTQYERMVAGLIYDPGDEEIMKEQVPFQDRLGEFVVYNRFWII